MLLVFFTTCATQATRELVGSDGAPEVAPYIQVTRLTSRVSPSMRVQVVHQHLTPLWRANKVRGLMCYNRKENRKCCGAVHLALNHLNLNRADRVRPEQGITFRSLRRNGHRPSTEVLGKAMLQHKCPREKITALDTLVKLGRIKA
jgi:hypothetical protein